MGNFVSTIRDANGSQSEIPHGVTILATGGREYRGPEYGYGTDPRILTQQEFETVLTRQPASVAALKSVAMIQCVGPAEQFCSRICCTVAIKNALALKELKPDAQVVILYKDIRTYGHYEQLYTEARRRGILFVRYDDEHLPQLSGHGSEALTLQVWDPGIRRTLHITPDQIVLSMPIVPQEDIRALAARFKVPVDADGFLLEAHVKLRPVDFASNGIFMAGLAHYPKLLDETIIQAQAAASRAARILSRETLTAGGRVAVVNPALCTGCLTCVRICPFNVPRMQPDLTGVGNIMGAANIEAAVCQGCGICAAECPARAIQLMHYTDDQMFAKVGALLQPALDLIPLDQLTITTG